ncbi:hypothetical protein X777_14802 [Ooceraea biroi]|uniref:Uncharacterized protein n=1 Tax=Ooceraea biroi TaxID=2015173 RepID=A0A026WRS9_OOCBI|nr:hypothetical protein X777_14802 [Ooceraea biroi]
MPFWKSWQKVYSSMGSSSERSCRYLQRFPRWHTFLRKSRQILFAESDVSVAPAFNPPAISMTCCCINAPEPAISNFFFNFFINKA